MAIFSANRTLRISLEFQSRNLLLSSSAKKGYNTSVPVRYSPNTETLKPNAQKPPPFEFHQRKEANLSQNRPLKGYRGAPKFLNSAQEHHADHCKTSDIFKEAEELPEFEDFSEDKVAERDELHTTSIWQEAEKLAIGLLAVRAITECELRKKLCSKKYPSNIVESVMADIKHRGLVNDGFYAESFSRSRWISSSWGPRRIKQALNRKGVNDVEVEKAMKLVFQGDEDLDDRQSLQHGMSKAAMDHLFLQASKQWVRGASQSTSFENRKMRIIRWLQYRGFNWGVTTSILKKLEARYPPLKEG